MSISDGMSNMENKYLISRKLLYLLLSMHFYTIHQFRGIFAKSKYGIDNNSLGLNQGMIFLATFIVNIWIAGISDRWNRPRTILQSLIAMSTLSFGMMVLGSMLEDSLFKRTVFWSILFFYLCCITPILSILDKLSLEYLSSIPGLGPMTYGRQRLFGTLGYIVITLVIEVAVRKGKDQFDLPAMLSTQVVVAGLASLSVFLFVSNSNTISNTTSSTSNENKESSNNKEDSSKKDDSNNKEVINNNSNTSNSNTNTSNNNTSSNSNFWQSLIRLFSFNYVFFIVIVLLNGISRAGMTFYLNIYISSFVKSDKTGLIGIFSKRPVFFTTLTGVLLEICIFLYSKQLTSLLGMYWPLMVAQVAGAIRFIGYYSLGQSDNLILYSMVLELLKGVNFGFTHMVGVQLATNMSPPEIKATSQMVYQGTFVGLGSLFCGLIFSTTFKADKLKDKEVDDSDKMADFKRFFIYNVYFTIFSISLFLVKYGLFDRVLSLTPWRSSTDVDSIKKKVEINSNTKNSIDDIKISGK